MINKHIQHDKLPQYPEPYWRASTDLPSFPKLNEDITADVVIVGGGISGITSAYLLVKEGLKVAILEAGKILNGTTGHTTAKITAQHDLIYDELIKNAGHEKAQLYYKANSDALQFIKKTVDEHKIECAFSKQDAYIYTNTETSIKKLMNEAEAYEKLGIIGQYTEQIPLQLPIKGAVIMKDQAQFHPLQYLNALVRYIVGHGGAIYENTTVVDLEHYTETKVITREGMSAKGNYVISCSHFPFHDGLSFYFARMYAERSYVLGIKSGKEYPGGMYLSADNPKRSIRDTTTSKGEKLILVGGENHKTGQGICTIKHYEALQAFAKENFEVQEIAYRWSTQDLTTLDKIPYVGRLTPESQNVFVATGYRKWGMSNSTAAAMVLRDLIMEKDNPYTDLYSPSRFDAGTDVKNLFVQNVDVVKHLIEGKIEIVTKRPEDLSNGQGAVVTVDGKRAGAYKDEQGDLYVVDTTCTHMGCEVEWNEGERSWDCPCHGSRFSFKGEVMEGPANKPLSRIVLEDNKEVMS